MNKKAYMRIGIGIFVVVIILFYFFVFRLNLTNAFEIEDKYVLGDKVKIEVGKDIEKIKVFTPSESFFVKPQSNIMLKLTETGNYKILFYGKENKEINFVVYNNLEEIINANLNNNFINATNATTNYTFNSSNSSTSNISRIRVGENVIWRKEIYS